MIILLCITHWPLPILFPPTFTIPHLSQARSGGEQPIAKQAVGYNPSPVLTSGKPQKQGLCLRNVQSVTLPANANYHLPKADPYRSTTDPEHRKPR
ncbi:hypothetical protein QBC40DRAFT_279852 [Triangularia verruculosa]|uniref:Uncharacterized protein n=1 Tax=Triangularia verruculosa TaxID=2587418 RepID=A0AAN6XJP9_9PEZI|nr:hypothetical protein QBC40DRAFT_279852 [Triangularia verruculosa]